MKTLKFLSMFAFLGLFLVSCSDDDDDNPDPVNEEEVITTMTITLTPQGGGGTVVTLVTRDIDGDGPGAPVDDVSGSLAENTVYDGAIVLLNETETPPENVTEEVEDEDDEHQFFYVVGGGLNATTEYANFDGDGNPLGTEFTLTTTTASTGTLQFVLRHEPTKPNTGLGDAGGDTDIERTFDVTIE